MPTQELLMQTMTPAMSTGLDLPLTLAAVKGGSGLWLMSLWKPVLMLVPFVVWARIVTAVYDKHAAQFFLPRKPWNIVHMVLGTLAAASGLVVSVVVGGEGGFWAGLLTSLLILGADLFAYMYMANKDERVPEARRIKIGMAPPAAERAKKKDDAAKAKLQTQVRLTIKSADEKGKFTVPVGVPQPETPEFAARLAAETVLIEAIGNRATQAEIGPAKDGAYQARYLIDSVYHPGQTMPAPEAGKVMDFWKLSGKQDVADRRRKQTSDVMVEMHEIKRLVRITSIGAQGGMRLTLLLDPEKSVQRDPKDLGLLDQQMTTLKEIASERQGVVLVVTPPDSGRTTLMYSLLRLHDAYISNVHTVEIDPQGSPDGVRVNKWDPQGATSAAPAPEFSTLVRSIMRRDPDVVAVADLPDAATAAEVSKADHQRTRTYLCMKGNDPFSAVQTYTKAAGDLRKAADSLHGVIVGKLVRKLCGNCRVNYPPTPDMLKKLGLPEGKVPQLFKKGGQVLIKNRPEACPVCKGIGYMGTEGVFEVYPIDKDDRELIAQGNLQGLKASWRKKSLPGLQQVAIRKAVDGVTSVEEIMRITGDGSVASVEAKPEPVKS